MKIISAAAAMAVLAGVAVVPAMPAMAQNQRIIEIYGNDPCPSSNGEEVVVCRRLPEKDRYRIPERLRTSEPERGVAANSGVALAESTRAASSGNLPDNCSTQGAMGHTGCFRQSVNENRAIRRQQAAETPVIED